MKIELKHGTRNGFYSYSLNLIVSDGNTRIDIDVLASDHKVDKDLIQQLRNIADDLENQNDQVDFHNSL